MAIELIVAVAIVIVALVVIAPPTANNPCKLVRTNSIPCCAGPAEFQ
jgi:hypothetical protein